MKTLIHWSASICRIWRPIRIFKMSLLWNHWFTKFRIGLKYISIQLGLRFVIFWNGIQFEADYSWNIPVKSTLFDVSWQNLSLKCPSELRTSLYVHLERGLVAILEFKGNFLFIRLNLIVTWRIKCSDNEFTGRVSKRYQSLCIKS